MMKSKPVRREKEVIGRSRSGRNIRKNSLVASDLDYASRQQGSAGSSRYGNNGGGGDSNASDNDTQPPPPSITVPAAVAATVITKPKAPKVNSSGRTTGHNTRVRPPPSSKEANR